MKRILGHMVSLLAAGMVVGVVVPACATNDQTIFVRSALAPPANRQASGCVYTNDPESPQLFAAKMDVGVTDSYFSVLLVGNQLIPRGDPSNNRAESSRVHLQGGVVRVTEANGAPIREFTSYSLGFADPQNNNQPDYGTIGLVTIDAPTAEILRGQLQNRLVSKTILIQVKVFGQALGGTDVESGEFQIPMQVCNGCLVSFAGANDTSRPADQQPNCGLPLTTTGGGGAAGPCFLGQDEFTPCQLCQGRAACNPMLLNQ